MKLIFQNSTFLCGMQIMFNYENVKFTLDETKVSSWISKIALTENVEIILLNYVFCTDEYLLNINQKYLEHDYYTDIITFPYKEGEIVESDLFISIDRVRENAQTMGNDIDEELRRVIVHGFLHLIGYSDKESKDVERMRAAENHYLGYYRKGIEKMVKYAS